MYYTPLGRCCWVSFPEKEGHGSLFFLSPSFALLLLTMLVHGGVLTALVACRSAEYVPSRARTLKKDGTRPWDNAGYRAFLPADWLVCCGTVLHGCTNDSLAKYQSTCWLGGGETGIVSITYTQIVHGREREIIPPTRTSPFSIGQLPSLGSPETSDGISQMRD